MPITTDKINTFLKILFIVLAAFVGFVVILIGALIFIEHWSFNWPSDEAAIRSFQENRVLYERVVAMVHEDRLRGFIPQHGAYLNPEWGSPNQPNSQVKNMPLARFDEYKAIFRTLGVHDGIIVGPSGDEEIRFEISSIGLLAVGPGSYKGISYKPNLRYYDIVTSLEDKDLPKKGNAVASGCYYRRIDSDWYVYRWEFD